MTDLLIRVHTNGVECDKVDGTRCPYRDNRSCWLFWQRERGIHGEQPVELEGEGPFLRCKECLAAEDVAKDPLCIDRRDNQYSTNPHMRDIY